MHSFWLIFLIIEIAGNKKRPLSHRKRQKIGDKRTTRKTDIGV